MTDSVTVAVQQGILRGKEEPSKCGRAYLSFRGIPYARPPVGPLRFQAPQLPEPWEGVRNAAKEGSPSPHIQSYVDEGFKGDEDCLFLNIYTPKLPERDDPLKAVMVFIHGGGFNNGSGTSEFYGPDYFINEDVILITINYRLGALGFLSTGDSTVPGNNGLKDQVMALRWIQQNIAKFGGDPDKVTIFGQSAGGASVEYLMLSPMSKGLFSKAIAQSGSVLNPWAFNNTQTARSKAFRFGEALGCKTDSSKELVDFLSTIPAQQLVEAVSKAMTEEEKDLGTVYFRPTVEQVTDGEDIFLHAEPIELLRQGKFHRVPFIAGVNSSEGLICLKEVMAKPAVLKKYDNQFEILVPRNLTENPEKGKEIAQKIKKFYFGDTLVSQETLLQYVDLSSDTWFVNGVYTSLKLHAAHSKAPVYLYLFSFDGRLGFLKRIIGAYRFPGVCHCDELGYLFFSPYLDIDTAESECPEDKLQKQFVKMWTNFAKTGNPSVPGVTWECFTESKPCYLNIDTEPHMNTHLLKERLAFWEEITK